MATEKEGPLKIHLVHGAKHHTVTLSLSHDDCKDMLDVQHLATAAKDITGIPFDRQKLIFKGKTISGSAGKNTSLRALGIKDGSKVMLLGSKPVSDVLPITAALADDVLAAAELPSPYKEDMARLQRFETSLAEETDNLQSLIKELDKCSRKRGSHMSTELEQLQKRVILLAECFMHLLESLDGLQFDSSDCTSRGKRKAMITQIQKMMNQCDELSSSIKQKVAAKK